MKKIITYLLLLTLAFSVHVTEQRPNMIFIPRGKG